MTTVVCEIERKYDPAGAGPAALDAVEAMIGVAGVAAVAPRDEQILDAVYYDTKDLRLLRAGVTLRRRTGGRDAGWHLKLPAVGVGGGDEIRLPLARPAARVPKELAGLVRARTRGAALAPVVRMRTSRGVIRLLDESSRTLQRALAAVPATEDAGAEDRDAALHEARKAAKRGRYAAEAALPALGGRARRQAERAKKLQELLGDHHDSVVARTVLRDLAGQARAAGEDTFTYGVMHERQACQAAQIERTLPLFAARTKN